jgi:protein SCO1
VRLAAAVAGLVCLVARGYGGVDPGAATAPRMEFAPPAAGTYTLQKIQPVAEAALLDSAGRAIKLSSVTTAKITLLTFFYTYCADPLGCPLAYQIFSELRDRLVRDARMAQQVRFVSVSLDPTNDTPAAIASYSSVISGNPNFEWRFLTAQSVGQLLPVLEDFGQDVSIERAADGTPTRTLHHMLKVFLIDRGAMVREIYSLAYLQPEVIFNDLQTLLLERRSERLAHR